MPLDLAVTAVLCEVEAGQEWRGGGQELPKPLDDDFKVPCIPPSSIPSLFSRHSSVNALDLLASSTANFSYRMQRWVHLRRSPPPPPPLFTFSFTLSPTAHLILVVLSFSVISPSLASSSVDLHLRLLFNSDHRGSVKHTTSSSNESLLRRLPRTT